MKKIKTLMVSLLFLVLFSMPFVVHGKEVEKINVYLFRGETCPHCEEAIEFFKSIEEDYGKYFNLVTYEVWYNAENSQKMSDIIDYMGIDVKGIPFILIGEDYYEGFDSDWADEIKDKIVKEYNRSSEERVDIIKNFENDSSKDYLPIIIGASVLVVIVVVVVLARRGESDETDNLNDKADLEEKVNKYNTEQDDNFLEDELSDSDFEKEDKKVLEKDNTRKTKKKIEDKSESTKKTSKDENVKGKTGKKASKKDNK